AGGAAFGAGPGRGPSAFARPLVAGPARRLGAAPGALAAELARAADAAASPVAPSFREMLSALAGEDAAPLHEVARSAPSPAGPVRAAAPDRNTPAPARAHARLDADAEIWVENAGLVLLWPFLETFFGRLGLLEERRFRDEAAAQRAVGLLQYLALGDPAPPELALPLDKVLCGLAPETVFDFGAEMTAAEAAECGELLAAVVQH